MNATPPHPRRAEPDEIEAALEKMPGQETHTIQTAPEPDVELSPFDRAIELTTGIAKLDAQIDELKAQRSALHKQLRAEQSKIVTAQIREAANAKQ